MSVNWEFLGGDTSRFAIKLSFSDDPDDGQAATPEMAASWGSFEIWVDGRNLCAQTDAGETVDAVHWYLLPLLEWLADNWDPLLHEERLPIEVAGSTAVRSLRATSYVAIDGRDTGAPDWQSWWARHSLLACREGGLFPEIVFRRWRDRVEISWDSLFIPGAPKSLAFAAPLGYGRPFVGDVAQPLHGVLRAAVDELCTRLGFSPRLLALRDRVAALAHERTDDRVAWLAGLGSTFTRMRQAWERVVDDLGDEGRQLLAAVAQPLYIAGTPKAGLMFGAVAPNITERDVAALTAFLLSLYRDEHAAAERLADDARWARIATSIDSRKAPWRQGYDLAEATFDELELDRAAGVDLDSVFVLLGVAAGEISLDDHAVRGLAAAGPSHRPVIAVNDSYPAHDRTGVRRFTQAHEVCHVLFDRTAARELAVASGPWAPPEVEQRANAFAAMLLMPERLVTAALRDVPGEVIDPGQLGDAADALGVSVRALAWHAVNLGLLPRMVAEQLGV